MSYKKVPMPYTKMSTWSFIRVFQILFLVLASVFLGGCSSGYDKVPPVVTSISPVAPSAVFLNTYRLQVGDVIDIKFRLNPELDETVTVLPDGTISTQVVESLNIYDLSLKEVNKKLRKEYEAELSNPHLKTIIRSFAPTRVYVSGEVVNAGEFIVVGPNLTLTQAIARAGGIKNSADPTNVIIIRRGAGEDPRVFKANYDAATQGADPTKDTRLAAYDVVFVPKSGAALAYKNYEQYFKQFVDPSISAATTYTLN